MNYGVFVMKITKFILLLLPLLALSSHAAVVTVSDGTNNWMLVDSASVDANFSTVGGWSNTGAADPGDWAGDSLFDSDRNATGASATWSFTSLTSGTYAVAVSYSFLANRPTAAPYTIIGDATYNVNQETAASGVSLSGGGNSADFDLLTSTLSVTGGSITVRLDDLDNTGNSSYVIADAVAIRMVAPVPEPSASLLLGLGTLGLLARRKR